MERKLLWENHRVSIRLTRPARTLAVLLASMMLGFLLTLQIQTAMNRPPATPEYSRDLSAVTIQRLEVEQKSLKDSIARLRAAHCHAAASRDLRRLQPFLADRGDGEAAPGGGCSGSTRSGRFGDSG